MTSDGYVFYPVYLFPTDSDPKSFLHEVIAKYVDFASAEEHITIFECGIAQPSLAVSVKSGRVEEIVWLSPRDLVLRRHPNQCY